ncbi:serine/threonine-protein kinase, partial [Elusimicrobiota bacterium]
MTNNKDWVLNNRYHIISKIGDGGFAKVYKAWDNMLQNFVAVKKINEEYSTDAKFLDLFRKEAINTAKLEHENIVRVTNFIKDEKNNFYIIMDLVFGCDLEYLLEKCLLDSIKIPHEISLYIISEVIKALDYAHLAKNSITGLPLNIVHRDISPGNIMLYFDGRIKLADFGIAKAGDIHIKDSKKEKLKGKISYMSPEQASGNTVDQRSDLFSAGLVLYEMLTLVKAFPGKADYSTIQKVQNADVDMNKLSATGVSEYILKLLQKSLQKLPDKRYPNAASMFLVLKRFLSKKAKTGELKESYNKFLALIMKDEMKRSMEQMKIDSEKDFDINPDIIVSEKTDVKALSKSSEESGKIIKSDLGEEKDKTVFDFVLDKAGKFKKIFFSLMYVTLIAFLIFTAIDMYMLLTPWGVKINFMIWPPALQVDTIPSGAEVNLFNASGKDIIDEDSYESATPINIEKILPGIYTMKLYKQGFKTMMRKINVFTDKTGEQKIAVAGSKKIDDIFFIPFEMDFEVTSYPKAADIYIDNKKVGKTPYFGTVNAGIHTIALEKEGYRTLGNKSKTIDDVKGGCVIDTSKPYSDKNYIDTDFWEVQIEESKERGNKYILNGILWRDFTVYSTPIGAQVFIDNKPESIGRTPLKDVSLSVGSHTISLEKKGFLPASRVVDVDEELRGTIDFVLYKEMIIDAYESGRPEKKLIADLQIKGTKFKGKTPFQAPLLPIEYTFIVTNYPKYSKTVLTRDLAKIDGKYVTIPVQLSPPSLGVHLKDTTTGNPVVSAAITVNGRFWKNADTKGHAIGALKSPGPVYKIGIKKAGYDDHQIGVLMKPGTQKSMDIRIGDPNSGKITIDISDISSTGSIYL